MAGRLLELKGSGDFTAGAGSVDGQGLGIVLDAEDQDEAYALAEEFFPPVIAGIPRGSIGVKELGGGVYSIEVGYRNAIPNENPATAGDTPAGTRPPGTGGDNAKQLTRDMTFSTGGATRKRLLSIKTRHKLAPANEQAPDFGGLIGVTKDGKVEGCEVIAPMCDFTITKRFPHLTLGWFRNMMDLIACTNKDAWLGMNGGEVLFKGCDGNYKDGDATPWTVTGKFGYSRNYARGENAFIDEMLTIGAIQIPDIRGWEHLWVVYKPKIEGVTIPNPNPPPATVTLEVLVDYPRWAYVEVVYNEGNLSTLGLDV